MQKNKQGWSIKTVVFMALFVAMNIVLTRVFVIDLGAYRISVGSVATILAGLWLGPIAGGVCGLVSDLLGCVLRGYAVNPLITVAAILWGFLPPLCRPILAKLQSRVKKTVVLCVVLFITAVCSSLICTTAGLVLFLGYNLYAILPGRLVQFCIMIPIYCVLTSLLYFSPLTGMITQLMAPTAFAKKAA
ncbi:MAG: folate family ECF transporter S component [Clostridiales bacterium]|nr:folate family ECF transporter S component [Clostridiales bacterium]